MNIDGKTKLLGLIGTPVEHSKSPAMYNYCFDKYGLNCAYLAFDVDMDHVADAISALRAFHVMGCNVTMPLKNAVIPYLDEVSPASRAIGSVNTIVNKDGKLYGYVTDGMGYTGELRRGGVEISGKVITLLGAGGAASAIAIEAALEGAKEIRVFNKRDGFWDRALANLKTIGDAAPACKISLSDLDDAEALRRASRPATSLPTPPASAWPRWTTPASSPTPASSVRASSSPTSSTTPRRPSCSARPRPPAAPPSTAWACSWARARRASSSTPGSTCR